MASLDDIKEAKRKAETELLKLKGVNGVGIGYKEVNGQTTDEISIHVFVNDKRDNVPPDEMIPSEIDGFKTDVIKRDSTAVPHSMDLGIYSTVVGGIACGKSFGSNEVGTIGAVVKSNQNGQHMILSSFHVLAVNTSYKIGDSISQPPGTTHAIAQLSEAALSGNTDAAVATINGSNRVQCDIVDIGSVKGVADAEELLIEKRTLVKKRGITTKVTQGIIGTVDASIIVAYDPPIGNWQLSDQILIKQNFTLFSDAGDSGSSIIDDSGNVVGLLVGGPRGGEVSYANRIQNVLEALSVSICTS